MAEIINDMNILIWPDFVFQETRNYYYVFNFPENVDVFFLSKLVLASIFVLYLWTPRYTCLYKVFLLWYNQVQGLQSEYVKVILNKEPMISLLKS